jgi:N-acetylated-alpha-linked acidic dipeptidase
VPGARRLDPSQATDIAKIPSTPISYGDAEPLLKALTGPVAPESFQGGLTGLTYHVGPGDTEARLNLDIAYETQRVTNVIAEIRGTTHPDEKVIVGGHLDAWTYGANDNVSGCTAVSEIGRSLGQLLKRGWRPERTIVLAGWDGEEYGLLGSTEWGEQFGNDLKKDAVAYINMDGVSGRSFSGGGVPSTDKLLTDVTKTVSHPGGGSLFDNWRGEAAAPTPERLGSGSDYTVLLDHLGVPSMVVGMSTGGGEYHSAYDDTYQTEHFLDPGYLGHQAASRTSGVLALRLANADALPLRYSDYAKQVDAYVAELQEIQKANPSAAQVDLKPLRDAAASWGTASAALEAHAAELVSSDSPLRAASAREQRADARGAAADHAGRHPRPAVVPPPGLSAGDQHRLRGAVPAGHPRRAGRRRRGDGHDVSRPAARLAAPSDPGRVARVGLGPGGGTEGPLDGQGRGGGTPQRPRVGGPAGSVT